MKKFTVEEMRLFIRLAVKQNHIERRSIREGEINGSISFL
jgi:hypothetical protein